MALEGRAAHQMFIQGASLPDTLATPLSIGVYGAWGVWPRLR